MQILTTGKNLDIGAALRRHIDDRLTASLNKYFDGPVRVQVVIEKQRATFTADCTLHLSTGLILQSGGEGGDAYVSFDSAAQHLEKRLRRYKRRLKDHHASRKQPVPAVSAPSFVIAASEDENDAEPDDLAATIIAESTREIAELTVGEAVMNLDISQLPFVLFRNAGHGGLNVVYRRDDGHIGWIDAPDNLNRMSG